MRTTSTPSRYSFLATIAAAILLVGAGGTTASAQITIGPYTFSGTDAFVDTASYSDGRCGGGSAYPTGSGDCVSNAVGYSPAVCVANMGCAPGNYATLSFTDVPILNRPGVDVVVFDTRFSADDYGIAAEYPAGSGTITPYETWTAAEQVDVATTGCAGQELFGVPVDLSRLGVPLGATVSVLRVGGSGGGCQPDLTMAAVLNDGTSCTVPAHCNDGNPCTTDSCEAGSCTHTPSGAEGCPECFDRSHCSDDNECTDEVCMDGTCSYPALAAGEMCTDGVCDGMAMCVACLTDSDCTEMTPRCDTTSNICVGCLGESDCGDENDCTGDVCTDGVCSNPSLEAGTMCAEGVCDGMAMCVECTDETHCEDENDCTADLCTDGACSNPPLEAGTACLGGVCNDRAVCVECLTDADCANGWLCSEENTCYQPSMPDAGPPPPDASDQVVVDAGGCGCSVPTDGRTPRAPLLALGVFGLLIWAKRRRR